MLYIDLDYIPRLSPYLRNFKRKHSYLYNASCPICGDSSTKKTKARLFIYRQKTGMFVMCHKCGYSTNLGNFIKYLDSNLYSEYVMERFKGNSKPRNDHVKLEDAYPMLKPIKMNLDSPEELLEDSVLETLKRLDTLPSTHYAVKYAKKRCIPDEMFHLLYYTPKFFKYVNTHIKQQFNNVSEDHPRLIIPFFNEFGKCFALQGRAFGKEQPKYYTIKIDEREEKIFGMERVDYSKPILIVEGPIDSLFLPNCLAVSGSSFDSPTIKKILTNATIVGDHEPRHKDIIKILEHNIEKGYRVCMFPDTFQYKDINEAIMGGLSREEISSLILDNTYSGLSAKARLTTYRKI